MSTTVIYDLAAAQWKSNIGPSINAVESDAFFAQQDSATGNLVVINEASKELAGGLVSDDLALPPATTFFGLDVIAEISADDLPHLARWENDLKVTFPGGLQANGSLEWNSSKGQWQLDPTGSAWVSTGYANAPVVGLNALQMRSEFTGSLWSVTGLRFNGDVFTPGAAFQNLPPIDTAKTNPQPWGAGLLAQLQSEAEKVPWILRPEYSRVRVIASDVPIPWLFD
jgi:hypothetical protein